ncbi:HD domain-containing phosphohydrolase [Nocardioides cheoyonin]|uniref:HD domain-containing phosphohydrolase n=1 Tax=Nocardioides cheoyonin TaxID=3156615 RepID=UPI0032B36EE0
MERATGPGRHPLPRRVEVLAGLSVAIDLGLGQPAEHMLRSAVIACGLADRLGLSREQRATVYYSTLVMWIGCHADSQEYARWFGDDIAVRQGAYLADSAGLPMMRFLVGNVARGEPLGTRVRVLATLLRDARGQLAALIHSHCTSAAALARHVGLSPDVEHALAYTFERYDGGGLPTGATGDAIPVEMRVAHVADYADVHHRLYGVDGAVAMARSKRGGHFDPAVVDALVADPAALLESPGDDAWERALAVAPDAEVRLDDAGLDRLLTAIGDFVDLKCPFTLGHSRRVAELAHEAAVRLGFSPAEATTVRRAGHLHDVGRLGVSNQVWSKPSELTASEWERVRMHPYLTDRVVTRIPGLAAERLVARSHHEHLDGSGYPLGLAGTALGRCERLLAAVVGYQAALEPRPYRDVLPPEAAAQRLRERATRGELDTECVETVLAAAGQKPARVRRDDTLTPREVEILGLVARGLSNREIATRLVLSEKTVRNHVERTYAKIGAANRVGASLYALEHGLAGRLHHG